MQRTVMLVMVFMGFGIMMLTAAGTDANDDKGDEKSYRIGAIMYDLSNKFHIYIQEGVKKFADEHSDAAISFVDSKADAALQLSQFETMLARGVDSIIMVPVDSTALSGMLDQAEESGVDVVVANLLPNEEDLERIGSYVGSQSIDAGIMQAEFIAEALGGQGNVAILIGDLGLEVARMRTEGNKQVFDKYPGINVVRELEGKWDRAQGLTIAENWLTSAIGEDLDAIVANNDEMAIGAFFAAQQVGRNDILIAGIDATPVALDYLGEGIDVTVFQSGIGQGYSAAEAAYLLAKGETVERFNWIPFELVTPDLRDEYLARYE